MEKAAGRDRFLRDSGSISSLSANEHPGSLPPLDAIRPAVRRRVGQRRRLEAEQKLYASLRERYEIVVEAPPQPKAAEATSR